MLAHGRGSGWGIYARLAGIALLIGAAIYAGLWLGEKSVRFPEDRPMQPAQPEQAQRQSETSALPPPPVYCSIHIPSGAGQSVALAEIGMAAKAGVHQFMVDVPLPWEGDADIFLDPIAWVCQADPEASIMLYVRVDPPPAWILAHPDEIVQKPGQEPVSVSLASSTWRRDVCAALEGFITGVKASQQKERILGYVMGGLEEGGWNHGSIYDMSPANVRGFRSWLQTFYKEPAALQQAWGAANAAFDTAPIPDMPDSPAICPLFWDVGEMQARADFLRYTSEITAEVILELAAHVKKLAGSDCKVYAPYGYTFEMTDSASGHFALGKLLRGDIDGFISPVSYIDRGVGGVGGLMGPADSARLHGKEWILLDDTRTGLVYDPATGEVSRPKNLRAEDVYAVQQRNFTTALIHGVGLSWADPEGDGWLHDAEMWSRLAKMKAIYQQIQADSAAGDLPKPLLAVVADENSRFYMHGARENVEVLLCQVRDSAARAGIPARYYLLSDVLDDHAPPANVYLFLNTFKLDADPRERLHRLLERNKAAAIWLYAPGYIAQTALVENISATVRIQAKMFEGPARSGSQALLPGRWINKDEPFGADLDWSPLFYIDDPSADALAKYRASGKASIAVRFFPEGWSSIFCAEPGLSTAMLREILCILELPLYFQPGSLRFLDAARFAPNLVAIHAKESGERLLDLDRTCDIQDLLSPDIGWPRKQSVAIPLKTGDTRLLKLTPVEEIEEQPAQEQAPS
ncbi:MAG TPA: hypothetical protein P5318_13235 [Candidatus Hydrogenedentes bacterium]|nr:hypothetical protein [Candidatus Hydrogenedentota bacterium]HRT21083.1 hypothetical protein [Candidatus Hydrogenedentota bacterium]HRT66044.1 hypothetical protein [Candidatus Hydrogenedentota bacterium]